MVVIVVSAFLSMQFVNETVENYSITEPCSVRTYIECVFEMLKMLDYQI